VTASGWLTLAVLAALVGALTCISLGLWRMLDREQAEHAKAIDARLAATSESARLRRSAIDADAHMFDLRAELEVERERVAELTAARPLPRADAIGELRILH
jgi:hypothetical protein